MKRLTALAHELAADGLMPEAGKAAHAEMHKALDAAAARYRDEIAEARAAVEIVEGRSLRAELDTHDMSFDDFVEAADFAAIDDAYRRAGRSISPDLARTYCEYLADAPNSSDPEGDLMDARVKVAAFGLVPKVKDYLETEAEAIATQWLGKYRVEIKGLSDGRQDVYRQFREMSAHPLDVDLARPRSWMQPTTILEANGKKTPLPRYDRHLLCAEDGLFSNDFNTWEAEVLNEELKRSGTIAWYRNPARATQESLGVIYEDGSGPRIVRPDFIFFARLADGSIVADIVDPHGTHFADALPRLRGLARYAEVHKGLYRRVEIVVKVGDTFRVLDLAEDKVRGAVALADSAKQLFESELANIYRPS